MISLQVEHNINFFEILFFTSSLMFKQHVFFFIVSKCRQQIKSIIPKVTIHFNIICHNGVSRR